MPALRGLEGLPWILLRGPKRPVHDEMTVRIVVAVASQTILAGSRCQGQGSVARVGLGYAEPSLSARPNAILATQNVAVIDIRPLSESDRAWAVQVETESWSEPVVARLGELVDPTSLPGFIAFLDGRRAGLASYAVRGKECELVTIRSLREGQGVGRALLDAVRAAASEAGCTRLWLITTNDNLRALKIYQRWGMEIVAFHRHAVTDARRHLKPSIPEHGAHDIPIAHELELELRLQPHRTSNSS
jgi:ribosomal protein S18 acetylase RimI-like enzyme